MFKVPTKMPRSKICYTKFCFSYDHDDKPASRSRDGIRYNGSLTCFIFTLDPDWLYQLEREFFVVPVSIRH